MLRSIDPNTGETLRTYDALTPDALDEADVDLSRAKDMSDAQAEDFEEKLRKLHRLHADGILTDEEFAREKREVLDRI